MYLTAKLMSHLKCRDLCGTLQMVEFNIYKYLQFIYLLYDIVY